MHHIKNPQHHTEDFKLANKEKLTEAQDRSPTFLVSHLLQNNGTAAKGRARKNQINGTETHFKTRDRQKESINKLKNRAGVGMVGVCGGVRAGGGGWRV